MVKFENRTGKLYIDGKRVIKGWESSTGWYWFAVEKDRMQTSNIGGKPVRDIIWFGYVQGFENEWGYFSQAELESLKGKVWEIKKIDLPFAGRR
jgi:hypothetical protein